MVSPELTLWEKIKEFIGDVAFEIFLWARNTSESEYIENIITGRDNV